MAHEDKGHFGAKHGAHQSLDGTIASALKDKASGGTIPCAAATAVGERLGASPAEVGRHLDLLEIQLVQCQLGLFGYGEGQKAVAPAASVAPKLAGLLREGLVNGRLPCAEAWRIAEVFGVPRLHVAQACEALGIKIKPCQLGAF